MGSKEKHSAKYIIEAKAKFVVEGVVEMLTEDGVTFPIHKDPILEKTYACKECGFVFYE